jgi:hypothetical protein
MSHKLFRIKAITTLFAVVVIGLIVAFADLWPTLQPGDKGTWSGALGTVATLIGTIWLATAETRRRKRQEMEMAKLAACSLRFKVKRVRDVLAKYDRQVLQIRNSGLTPDYISYVSELRAAGEWTREEVAPLVALDRDLAYRLEMTREHIYHSIGQMELFGLNPPPNSTVLEIATMGAMAIGFQVTVRFLDEAAKIMWDAIGNHGYSFLTTFGSENDVQA